MAGDWIKMRTNLGSDPAVIQIATTLECGEDCVVGMLHRLWSWADGQLRDCNARGVTLLWIDRYIGVTGFAQCLIDVGWLEATKDGVRFVNFDRHMSQTAKRRALTASRVKRSRSAKCNAPSVTKALPEKRREEENTTYSLKGDTELPEVLDSPKFKAAWADFQSHRREKKSKMTPTAVKRALAKLAAMGHDRAIAALEHSTANGYTGIFEPDRKDVKHGKPISVESTGRVRDRDWSHLEPGAASGAGS